MLTIASPYRETTSQFGYSRLPHNPTAASVVTDLLYHRSGLLGVSALSPGMHELLASDSPYAAEAINLFVYRIGRELGSLVAALGRAHN